MTRPRDRAASACASMCGGCSTGFVGELLCELLVRERDPCELRNDREGAALLLGVSVALM